MKLFFAPGACSMAPHIVLEELGMKYDASRVNLANKDPEFVKLNPKGYVPAVWTDGHGLLTEAQVILQYLADQKPDAKLMPVTGSWERYRALEMLNFIATELHKGFANLFGADKIHPSEKKAADELREAAKLKLATRFEMLVEPLAKHKFLLGDQFSVCDAYLFTVLTWARKMGFDLNRWPSIASYFERVQNRPSVQSAMKAEGLIQ